MPGEPISSVDGLWNDERGRMMGKSLLGKRGMAARARVLWSYGGLAMSISH
jgi:hypothetical protein